MNDRVMQWGVSVVQLIIALFVGQVVILALADYFDGSWWSLSARAAWVIATIFVYAWSVTTWRDLKKSGFVPSHQTAVGDVGPVPDFSAAEISIPDELACQSKRDECGGWMSPGVPGKQCFPCFIGDTLQRIDDLEKARSP